MSYPILTSFHLSSPSNEDLPLRKIPGSYGLPFFGPIRDRWDFFYLQGEHNFFKTRVKKYDSTVFRVNMPPGPWISNDSRVIVLLDANSFPILFDTSKVEKRNVLTGTYVPSTSYYGGYRVCAYLDPSAPTHGSVKSLLLSFLASKHDEFIPLLQTCMENLFSELEKELQDTNKVEFNKLSDVLIFEFIFKLLCDGKSPSETKLKSNGPSMLKKWLIGQVTPMKTLGLPMFLWPIEDFILHCIGLPSFFVKSDYQKLYVAFNTSASSFLDKAESFGLGREEACHNLVFIAGFNAFGGFLRFFPSMIKWVGFAGESLQHELASEIRTIIKSEGGVTMSAINKMMLVKSVVNEALRIEPPLPYQYGKAKEDLIIESHDEKFKVKKGEMLFGYQPFATKDPKILDEPEKFIGDRYVGEGEKLLKYVLWSNGSNTDGPTVDNKQCAGKNVVELMSRVLLVEFFLKYDSFSVEVNKNGTVSLLSLKKASNNP